jgi:hypothetical protein
VPTPDPRSTGEPPRDPSDRGTPDRPGHPSGVPRTPPAGSPGPPRPDPSGRTAYLPPRAAKARKLILRSQLGRGWIVASALFGLVILAAGGLYLARAGRPGPPWVRVAALEALPAGAVTEVPAAAGSAGRALAGQVVVVDRRGDEPRVFLAAPGPCKVVAAGAGFARPCDGQRWDAEGRPAAGEATPALDRRPAVFARGDLYVLPG